MKETGWIDNCKICNDGACNQIDQYRAAGMSVRAACEKMSNDCEGQFTADQIRGRWKFHAKGQGGRTSPTMSDELILAKAETIKAIRRARKRIVETMSCVCEDCERDRESRPAWNEVWNDPNTVDEAIKKLAIKQLVNPETEVWRSM